jgi:hypothetical protein
LASSSSGVAQSGSYAVDGRSERVVKLRAVFSPSLATQHLDQLARHETECYSPSHVNKTLFLKIEFASEYNKQNDKDTPGGD